MGAHPEDRRRGLPEEVPEGQGHPGRRALRRQALHRAVHAISADKLAPKERFLFLVNRTGDAMALPGFAGDVLCGAAGDGGLALGPREVAVVRRPLA
ncbi:Beta-galactosidase C-terminal domain [Streptomyces sp. NPDC059349]|uniref:Beta-galactosidase C-terminal domain n=1 Tax=Streptomyces sp. NPDC059349 TaxID=3346808 RepID=UPI0036AC92FD